MPKQQRSSWSDLQPELLELILQKLTLTDYLKCRELCSSWRTAVDNALSTKRRCPPAPQFPLLLTFPAATNSPVSVNILNLTDNSVHTMPTKFHHTTRVATVDGWLILQNFYYHVGEGRSYGLIGFLNPVSGVKFMLPTLSLVIGGDPKRETLSSNRVVLSSAPDHPELLVAIRVLIERGGRFKQQVSFCKVTDKSWTLIEIKEYRTMIFADIAIHGYKLYAITEGGSSEFVVIFNLSDPNAITVEKLVMLEPKPNPIRSRSKVKNGFLHCNNLAKSFLVRDSTCGELLLVLYLVDSIEKPGCGESESVIRTKEFRVFKLDMNGPRWLKVDNLGHRALLLDGIGIHVISSSQFNESPGDLIVHNCVFFCVVNTLSIDSFSKIDLGVFSLTDKSIRRFSPDPSSQVSGKEQKN